MADFNNENNENNENNVGENQYQGMVTVIAVEGQYDNHACLIDLSKIHYHITKCNTKKQSEEKFKEKSQSNLNDLILIFSELCINGNGNGANDENVERNENIHDKLQKIFLELFWLFSEIDSDFGEISKIIVNMFIQTSDKHFPDLIKYVCNELFYKSFDELIYGDDNIHIFNTYCEAH